jgi:hypothetical protein
LSCIVPAFCQFEFPHLFGLAILVLLAAGLIGAWLTYQPLQSVAPHEGEPQATGDTTWYLLGLGLAALAAAGWGSGRWLLAIVLTVLAVLALWRSWRIGWPNDSMFGDMTTRLGLLALSLFALFGCAYGLRSWRWAA